MIYIALQTFESHLFFWRKTLLNRVALLPTYALEISPNSALTTGDSAVSLQSTLHLALYPCPDLACTRAVTSKGGHLGSQSCPRWLWHACQSSSVSCSLESCPRHVWAATTQPLKCSTAGLKVNVVRSSQLVFPAHRLTWKDKLQNEDFYFSVGVLSHSWQMLRFCPYGGRSANWLFTGTLLWKKYRTILAKKDYS